MPTDFQQTFVPKQTSVMPPLPKRAHPVSFFMLIGVVVFLISAVGAGGSFAYKIFIVQKNDSLAAQLKTARDSIDTKLIADLKRYDARIASAKKVLGGHTTLAPLFALLEQVTLQNVRFISFNFANVPEAHLISLKLHGEAKNYPAIALESDAISASGAISSPVVTGLKAGTGGNIAFDVAAIVDPKLISYKSSLTDVPQAQTQVVPNSQNSQAVNLPSVAAPTIATSTPPPPPPPGKPVAPGTKK